MTPKSSKTRLIMLAPLACVLTAGCGDDRAGFETGCDQDDADACHELGQLLIHGIGGSMDRKAGRLRLEQACELGRADSCRIAAGLSYARRDKRARRYLTWGCDGGDAESCVDLAWMVEHGEGGDADPAAAKGFYEKGCEGGDGAGCFFLKLERDAR